MPLIKGILSFPTLFVPKVAQGATEPKFSCSVLIRPGDPQIAELQAAVEEAKRSCLTGYRGADECFDTYNNKYRGKEYYDPKFSGWYVFSCTAKADDRPAVVDENRQPIIDPSTVFPGAVVYVHAGISYYAKGKTGIGGWLNGVMLTNEEPPMGRLDSKPTVDQMFASMGSAPASSTPGVPPLPAPPPVTTPAKMMTDKAQGATYESFIAAGWTDDQLIQHGYMVPAF